MGENDSPRKGKLIVNDFNFTELEDDEDDLLDSASTDKTDAHHHPNAWGVLVFEIPPPPCGSVGPPPLCLHHQNCCH